MLAALTDGWVARQIDSAFAPRAKNIARRKEGITGVSEFPDVREQRVDPFAGSTFAPCAPPRHAALRAARRTDGSLSFSTSKDLTSSAVEAAMQGATDRSTGSRLGFHKDPFEIMPLELRSFAEPFEELRDASDAWHAAHGKRPTVFLANMGPVSHHTARATYSKNFFEAGGFEVIGNDGFRDADAAADAFAESGATIAVICSSDKLYPELVPQLAGKLKAAGSKIGRAGGQSRRQRSGLASRRRRSIHLHQMRRAGHAARNAPRRRCPRNERSDRAMTVIPNFSEVPLLSRTGALRPAAPTAPP